MDDIHRSKVIAFIPKIKECAYEAEKTRRDYLSQCSEYYDKYLNDYLMNEKRFWMMNEEMKVELDIRDKNDAEEVDVKKGCVKRSRQQELEEEKQQKERKKKKRGTGRPRGRPKKQKMCFTMEDLRMKASDPFGAKRHTRPKRKESPASDAAAAAAAVEELE